MEMTATERQQHFLKLAATHAEDFKTRVTKHDRENSFPFENIEALKTSGYLNMTLPAELGGGGANLPDLVMAQERLARGDGPTAVAVNMHIFNVAVRADLWRLGDEKQRPFLEASARDSLILCSGTSDPRMNTVIGFAGLNDTTRHAERVDGGYRVNGRAGFGTLCACADFFEETAHYDDPVEGPQCLFFTVPAKTAPQGSGQLGHHEYPVFLESRYRLGERLHTRRECDGAPGPRLGHLQQCLCLVVYDFGFGLLPGYSAGRSRSCDQLGVRTDPGSLRSPGEPLPG